MAAPKKAPLTPLKIAIILGLVLLGLIAASFALRVAQPMLQDLQRNMGLNLSAPMTNQASYDMGLAGESALATRQSKGMVGGGVASSIAPYPPTAPTAGDTAEEYEVTSYTAYIETKNLEETCGKFIDLKTRKDVIFQNSDENERGCTYNFKVTKDKTEEILALINSLDPKTLNENIYTIKKILEEYESQEAILKKKAEAIEATLTEAIAAYDEVAAQARATRDTESLTKVMNSKIDLVQRLTNERIQNNAQLEQLARAKAEQADQLIYTNFYVSVVEDTYFNGRDLQESWEQAVKDFVAAANAIVQGTTIGLVVLLLSIVQFAIYGVILLFVAKYAWRFARDVWKK